MKPERVRRYWYLVKGQLLCEVNTDVSLSVHLNLRPRCLELERSLFGSQKIRGDYAATKFYTGLPAWSVFAGLFNYLEEKAAHLKAWRSGTESDSTSVRRGPQPWKDIPIVSNSLLCWCICGRAYLTG